MLIGHVGKEPEIRTLESGVKIASFSFATTDKGYTTSAGAKIPDKTEWHNIVIWRKLADVVEQYVHKGDKLYLEGKLRTRSYESGGVTRYVAEIFVDQMEMLSSKPQHVQQPQQNNMQAYGNNNFPPQQPMPYPNIDDLPF